MISFRYHLVSLIGIFLAIALGVVIGTTALNGAVVGDLRRQVSDLKQSNAASQTQSHNLQAQAGSADLLAQTFGGKIAAGALGKKAVVLVGAPGASKGMRQAIAGQITAAGGSVAGEVQLSKEFDDPRRAADIQSLATSGAHPMGLQLPTTDSPGLLAGALLGYVLLGHGQGTDLTQVLAGFTTLNMLKVDSSAMAAGNALVLVAPGGLPKSDEGGAMLQSFATELGTLGGPTVVAGDAASANQNGLIALVRGDDAAQKAVSTVDDAGSSLGQLTTALAVADALSGHKGQYGTAAGAEGLLPGASN
ncbi:MAG TPA: copper transporter [Jatrophihabitans sp.]|nr:copper transporter [Jatrophihabitans sp.]